MGILKISKVNTLLVSITMLAVLLCWNSPAQAEQDGNYIYTVTGGEAQIIEYTGTEPEIVIPSTLGGLTVTSIGEAAFLGCTGLTSISIPQGVASIGYRAFYACTSLTNIIVAGDNLNYASINGVLYNKAGTILITCPQGLTSISIPPGVTSIGDEAMYYCTKLISISIPEGVTSIGNYAFYGCEGLTSISIPQGVTSIGNYAFWGCKGLTSISIPQGVTLISEGAFIGCTGLTSISIPAGVTSIGGWAFAYDAGLTSINIPQEVTRIGQNAFDGCKGLTNISLPPGLTSIEPYCFYGTSITNITIPEGVTTISDYAFFDCNLANLTIPASVQSTGNQAFYCTNMWWIKFLSATTTIYDSAYSIRASLIVGYDPSTAKDYATKYGRGFEAISSPTPPSSLKSITITTPATKWKYMVGEELDISGLVVTGTYIDGSTQVENITADNISGFDSSAPATKQVLTIDVDGKTTYYTVQILAQLTDGDFAYKETPTGEAQVIGYTGRKTDIVIPSTLGGLPVTSIGEYAFRYNDTITGVTIPQGVESIGKGAFYGTFLENITIPPSVNSIGAEAFSSSKLTSINVPAGVTVIADRTFYACQSLASITIPQNLSSIGAEAFYGCEGLKNINIPSGVTSIGSGAFDGCTCLTSINIPAAVTSIGELAFSNGYYLTSITVDAGNQNYSSKNGVLCNKAGDTLIAYPSGLESLDIPQGVTRIGSYGCGGCIRLTNVIIPTSIANVGYRAFWGCGGLATITFSSPTTAINSDEYTIWPYAKIIAYDPSTAKVYASQYGRTFELIGTSTDYNYTVTNGQAQIIGYAGTDQDLVIPGMLGGAPVTSISRLSRSDITSVIIPEGVTRIGSMAFADCTSLNSITISQSVISIGNQAFYDCSSLTNINIPKGVKDIGYTPFVYCSSLASINVEADNLNYSSINGLLCNKTGTTLITCPGGLINVVIPSGVTSIGEGSFQRCAGLISIVIPESVTNIGADAFSGCSGLTSITIPESVTSIGIGAFYGCAGLTSISLPQRLTSIEDNVFGECLNLISITIPSSITSIGNGAFLGCNMSSIDIPEGVKNIGEVAFAECNSLTSISIPSSVQAIGQSAFDACLNLTSITFNSATTTIPDDEYTIPDSAKIMGYDPSTAKDYAAKYCRTFETIFTTKSLQSIDITTLPTKLTYTVGDALDITGLEVTGTYSDGSTQLEEVTAADVSGFNSSSMFTDQVLTITIGDQTTTYTVSISNIEVNTVPMQITIPADVTDAVLVTNPDNGEVTVPEVIVQSSTEIGIVEVSIPDGTQIMGPQDWDGTINLPQVVANDSVTVTPDSGNTASVCAAIEIGLNDTALTFSQPVRILLSGQGGKNAGWIRNSIFTPITYQMASDSADALSSNPDGIITVGNDLVIWTSHFTTFVAYTETVNDKTLIITGPDSITIKDKSKSAAYKAKILNQNGKKMFSENITWSLQELVTGVSIDSATGEVTVDNTARTGSFTVAATDGSVTGMKMVSLIVAASVVTSIEITGPESVPILDKSKSATYKAKVLDQSGNKMSNETVTWSLQAPVTGVSIDSATGEVTVDKTASAGSFTVVAASNTDNRIKTTDTVKLVKNNGGGH